MTAVAESETESPAPATPTKARGGWAPRRSSAFAWVFATGGLAFGIAPLHDNSFMWHLRTGRSILDSGIPHSDPYSYTAEGTKWIAQSWLVELLYGVLDAAWGSWGIRLMGALVGAIVGFLVFYVAWRSANDRARATAIATVVFACMLNVWSERPLMYGLLAMLVLVTIVEVPDSLVGRRPMVSIPILMWLWASSHGTFAIGFGYLFMHLVGQWLDSRPPTKANEREHTLLRASVVGGAVTLANPYFVDLLLFPLALMGRGEVLVDVQEWQSPNFRELGGYFFAAVIVMTIAVLARRTPSRRDVLMSAVFLVLGLWAVRNVGLAAIVVLPIVCRQVRVDGDPGDDRNRLNRMIVAFALISIALLGVKAYGEDNWDLEHYPVAAYDAYEKAGLEGRRLYTTDAWSGYVILRAYPRQQVFFDDRYDMYPIDVNQDYTKIAALKQGWDGLLDEYDVEAVMWPEAGALVQALALDPDWTELHRDKEAVVMVRKTLRP
jgi:hypothetical protein